MAPAGSRNGQRDALLILADRQVLDAKPSGLHHDEGAARQRVGNLRERGIDRCGPLGGHPACHPQQ